VRKETLNIDRRNIENGRDSRFQNKKESQGAFGGCEIAFE